MSTKHTPHTPGPWTMHPLALLDGLQRSVARSDVLREAIRRGLADLERTLPTLTEGGSDP